MREDRDRYVISLRIRLGTLSRPVSIPDVFDSIDAQQFRETYHAGIAIGTTVLNDIVKPAIALVCPGSRSQ
jgi:hypothetical protein